MAWQGEEEEEEEGTIIISSIISSSSREEEEEDLRWCHQTVGMNHYYSVYSAVVVSEPAAAGPEEAKTAGRTVLAPYDEAGTSGHPGTAVLTLPPLTPPLTPLLTPLPPQPSSRSYPPPPNPAPRTPFLPPAAPGTPVENGVVERYPSSPQRMWVCR